MFAGGFFVVGFGFVVVFWLGVGFWALAGVLGFGFGFAGAGVSFYWCIGEWIEIFNDA